MPCGFSAKSKDIFYRKGRFPCPVCKIHDITSEECLSMTRNKMLINEINLYLKKKNYEKLLKIFEKYKNDPQILLDESYDCLKKKIKSRQKEIKVMLNKILDGYSDDLLKKIDMERDLKLKDLAEKNQQIETLDLVNLNHDKNLDIDSKLVFYKKSKIEIDKGINLVKNIIGDLKEPKFKLTDSSDNIGVTKLFGELYLKEETFIYFNKEEIDDDSRSEATIKLIINNFSLLKDKKNFRVYSKKCIIRKF
ncbi:hypothetical protein BpHYR1_025645 [Brachionus plicatilis]|uniref:Uncharacterized protein n=1 Tax=Brachionus plicatilis TaxID=10195 RepID=A0A3M7STT3_BRAPC|nr:hypothetical protein BpHYR1_025645 [Brachionus plicatilis]